MAAAAVLFTALGSGRLWDEDEPKNATCAREMLERGDWVVPSFNGELRTDKPILLYWLMMPVYAVLGASELAARLPSALMALGTALCTYHLGRILFRAEVGLWAGLIVSTSILFAVSGRAATPDATLIFLSTLAVLLFVREGNWSEDQVALRGTFNGNTLLPRSWLRFAPAYLVLGLAVLAKGPVGVLLPIAVLGSTLLWLNTRIATDRMTDTQQRSWLKQVIHGLTQLVRAFPATTWSMRPLTLAVLVLLVAAPWYVLVGLRTDGAWLAGFFGKHNLQRFQQPLEGHQGSVLYYLPAIMIGMFPWSIFLPLSVWTFVRALVRGEGRPGHVLVVAWCCVWILPFSFSGTKLPSYVLPAYPALALVVASWIDCWAAKRATISSWWPRVAYASAAAVGLTALVVLRWGKLDLLPQEELVGLVGVVLLVGAAIALYLAERQRLQHSAAAMAVTAVLFCASGFSLATHCVSVHQNSAPLAETAREYAGDKAVIATYKYSPPSIVFYAEAIVHRCSQAGDVNDFLSRERNGFVVVPADEFEAIATDLPAGVVVLERQPRFLRPGDEVLLLGRRSELASTTMDKRVAY